MFKCVSIRLHGCYREWKGLARKSINHTSWVAVVTPTDRPYSAHHRCVLERFGELFCCNFGFFHFPLV